MKRSEKFDKYLSGEVLYGEDLSREGIKEWYRSEEEAFSKLVANEHGEKYRHHALNQYHGFSKLTHSRYDVVLGLGGASGEEFLPIRERVGKVFMVEPSDHFAKNHVQGIEFEYIKPTTSGVIPFGSESFDLVTSLGVLHHIPRVSLSVSEIGRVMKSGAQCLMREPVISMGDWRNPRIGLTSKERGIPLKLLDRFVDEAGLTIRHRALCEFSLLANALRLVGIEPNNSLAATRIDSILSKAFGWNLRHYHATTWYQRIRPRSIYLVLEKLSSS